MISFRKYAVALVGEIDKMYRQLTVHSEQVLLRFNTSEPIRTTNYKSYLVIKTTNAGRRGRRTTLPKGSTACSGMLLYVDVFIEGDETVN